MKSLKICCSKRVPKTNTPVNPKANNNAQNSTQTKFPVVSLYEYNVYAPVNLLAPSANSMKLNNISTPSSANVNKFSVFFASVCMSYFLNLS